jgi:hypothetical protein
LGEKLLPNILYSFEGLIIIVLPYFKVAEKSATFIENPFSVNKNIKVFRKSASFLVKFDLGPHQTFVIFPFHFPC